MKMSIASFMKITIQNNAEAIDVVMNGNLDTLAAEQVEPQIQELEKMVTKPMVIDCTALEYVASAGLRLLLRIRKAAKASGQDVTLLSVNENVMEVLKVTHFDRMFAIR